VSLFARKPRPAPVRGPVVLTLPSDPVEGVPPFLQHTLHPWLIESVRLNPEFADRIHLQMRGGSLEGDGLLAAVNTVLKLWDEEGSSFPVGADWVTSQTRLYRGDGTSGTAEWIDRIRLLDRILADAGSVWRVCLQPLSLQRRLDPADVGAAQGAVQAAAAASRPEAGTDLAQAWEAAYGRHPSPSEAYRLAIRAVEHIALPLVIPNDQIPTLGKARARIASSPGKWRVDVGQGLTGEALAGLIGTLWHGQDDRHGGGPNFAAMTQIDAEGAVQLAVVLVRWFADGRVKQVP
jgi:hypothetical protein